MKQILFLLLLDVDLTLIGVIHGFKEANPMVAYLLEMGLIGIFIFLALKIIQYYSLKKLLIISPQPKGFKILLIILLTLIVFNNIGVVAGL